MARRKIELHLPFLVIGVEDMQIKLSKPQHRNLTESPNSLPPPTGSTGRFLALRDGSAVGYRETIEGVAADLAPGSGYGLSSTQPTRPPIGLNAAQQSGKASLRRQSSLAGVKRKTSVKNSPC